VLAQPASKPETRMNIGRLNFILRAFVSGGLFPFNLQPQLYKPADDFKVKSPLRNRGACNRQPTQISPLLSALRASCADGARLDSIRLSSSGLMMRREPSVITSLSEGMSRATNTWP